MLVQPVWQQLSFERVIAALFILLGVAPFIYAVYHRVFHSLHHVNRSIPCLGVSLGVIIPMASRETDISGFTTFTPRTDPTSGSHLILCLSTPRRGLHDIHGHGKRRVLGQVFATHALQSMEDVMLLHIRQLCAALDGQLPKTGKRYSPKVQEPRCTTW
ncbi:hypothetical protein AOCH_001950 [Aspergillus ochraceoroseus]|uniref:Uncharacterized protein n=1 Tax=Aspergillus ochraceoroseus TaxID=138278 RepID=A0A0F8UEY5_9EURO|nr:hypothetical protein AOCH_001950 [Aspergillus ochraceoroseus]